jgi:Recombinase
VRRIAELRIAELRTAGQSYRQIAATLDAEGLAPRRAARWSAMSVRNIAESRAPLTTSPYGVTVVLQNSSMNYGSAELG